MRLVQVRFERQWYSYVTSVLEPDILPPFVVADLYRRRWRIEDAFNILKLVQSGLSLDWLCQWHQTATLGYLAFDAVLLTSATLSLML